MQVKIFDISEGQISINENCLLIPELKRIVDTYENPIPVLCFVYYMTDPLAPYANLNEERRSEILLEDYEGDYTLDDEPVYKAIEKLTRLYETPNMSLLKKARKGLENLGDYLASATITEGKDGNFNAYTMALSRIGKISQEFRTLEKEVQDELRIRGNQNTGYDEF